MEIRAIMFNFGYSRWSLMWHRPQSVKFRFEEGFYTFKKLWLDVFLKY